MINTPGVMIEGTAQSVVCSVAYNCKKNKPSIVWNYPDMQSTVKTMEISKNTYNTSSNLTFIGSLNDNGKELKCTAEFNKGETSDSLVLQITRKFFLTSFIELTYLHAGTPILTQILNLQ